MSTQLKHFFNKERVESLARELSRTSPDFDVKRFLRESLQGLDALELMGRAWHLADALHRHLPSDFHEAARQILAALEQAPSPEDEASGSMGSFRYLPHVLYVARYGIGHFEPAMALQHALTQRFTAEFSIRPFLERYPEATLRRLETWASDPSPHVRRLVSEGTRPRLPWAPRLRAFQKDPRPVLALLERLKDDPSLYVRRSVANNLNDIGKDHPGLLVEVSAAWLKNATNERRWVVQHGLRSLVKKGDPGALRLLGAGKRPNVRVEDVQLSPRRLPIGETLSFSCTVVSLAKAPQRLLVDFVVHFVKSNGATAPRVFKLTKVTSGAGERIEVKSRVCFRQMSTRTHHPGEHRLELQINGVLFPLGTVKVVPAKG